MNTADLKLTFRFRCSVIGSHHSWKNHLCWQKLCGACREHDAPVPEWPMLFMKPTSSVIGPDDLIHLPPQSVQVEHEVELLSSW